MAKNFEHPTIVAQYDRHIRCLIPGYELVHLQIQALLKTYLKADPKILIVGCGTGYELSYLLEKFADAEIVALDPSQEMLNKAQANLLGHARVGQVQFVLGDTSTLYQFRQKFDAALSILVAHFIPDKAKLGFFQEIAQSLKPGGVCINYDLMHIDSAEERLRLKYLTQLIGLSEQQSDKMLERLDDDFHLISNAQLKQIYRYSGFNNVQCFSQISNFFGYFATK